MFNPIMDLDAEPLRKLADCIPQIRDAEPAVATSELLLEIKRHLAQPSAETPAVLSAAYEALKLLAAEHPSTALVEALVSIGHYHALASNPLPGLAPAVDAVATSRLIGDKTTLMKALRLKAWLLSESGNFPDAVACIAEAVKMAQQLSDIAAECSCWNFLGMVFQQAGQAAEAIKYYERCIELASDNPACRIYKDGALANVASAATEAGDVRRAFPAAQLAVLDTAEPANAVEADIRAMREQIFARVLVDLGDVDRAAKHVAKAQKYADQSGMPRSKLFVAATQALVEIAKGKPDMGLTRMKSTLEAARAKSKGQLPAILSASVKAYELCGQPEVALTNLHELLDNKKEQTQAQIVMHHRIHMAQIGVQDEAPPQLIGSTLEDRQKELRVRLQDRDLVRRNMRVLEEQSVAAELHDDTTGEHCYRVGRLSALLGQEVGLEDDICFLMDLCARLHDIGKLVVPDAILLKPGKLTPGEREIMQRHTTAGADILGRINLPQIHIAEAIARHHHERWDGRGYPDGISGSAIPLPARITALADVFDALTHKRPYKEAWPVHAALAEIRELSGKQFDPELCSLFLDLVPRLQREVGDLDYYLGADAKNADFIQARRSIAASLKGSDPNVSLFDLRR